MTHALYFSPTGGTKKAAEALVWGLGGEAEWHDISSRNFHSEDVLIEPGDICVLALPCFAGRAPKFAMSRVASLRGEGADAILLTSFGNRAIEDILLEMNQGMLCAGFYVRGAVAASTQHTFCPRIGSGRPNAADMREITGFGKRLAEQTDRSDAPLQLPGNVPWRDLSASHFHPVASAKCNRCGTCVATCPVGAIAADSPDRTNERACLGCMQCIRVCPQDARHMREEDRKAACQMLARLGASGPPKPNQLFIR